MTIISKRAWPVLAMLTSTLAATSAPLRAAPDDMPPTTMPPIHGALTAPAETERQPRATVSFAPYRYGDILWENDRTAHRIYGQPLESAEPPSTSGMDAWGKNVRWPFMERQLRTGDQHAYHGEGLDFYNVNTFRGLAGWASGRTTSCGCRAIIAATRS
jgi:hypothetical protein